MNSTTELQDLTLNWATQLSLPIAHFESATSTQDKAKENLALFNKAKTNPPSFLITCNQQTHGRGRGSNLWSNSIKNDSFLSTWAFDLQQPVQPILSPLIGLSLYSSLKQVWPNVEFHLKAPNDIYIKKLKVAGILSEILSQGSQNTLLIGIGLNLLSPISNESNSTHLSKYTSSPLDQWPEFLTQLSTSLLNLMQDLTPTNLTNVQCKQLYNAMKGFPLYQGQLQKISAHCDLVFKTQTINWHKL